jgi:hypothetical protein
MHAMPATRVTIPMVVAVSTVLALVLPAIVPGCGPASPDVDKLALYTPESLASELAFRFRALNPDAKASRRRAKSESGKSVVQRVERTTKAEKKGAGVKKKATGPTTIDNVLDDIDDKLDLIQGISRPEACRKMIDTLSQDNSLTESDKKTLTDLVGQLADGH